MRNLVLIFAVAGQLISCNSKKNEQIIKPLSKENPVIAKDSLIKVNIYEGLLPCADCSGIETVLKIYQGDGTIESYKFELTTIYKGKQPEKTFTQKGNFNYERGLENDPDGTIYVLNWDKPESDRIYYGYKSENPKKMYLLTNKREIIKSELNYFLTLKK
ncbi:copper resistance protein NlpE N-terminal domain-containing protein [Flavobacterium sp. ANB]|uniref:copper resistance protein NlpE N-terminal domain-containing protein n=1 Tax=unclassified Flavobacterium TaxID=196869 RepID=UPI0012B743ED|nr:MULTISPECIES: copper resistance protein NlpE N-terminal domain-containing protein [unclassified Flavobacterium]MBF4516766.1 copper resistance protein NlpE N-terminal domain-containing protein [Flavobacterium sp. ANB]MTD69338.1 copper resistance protein NlpE [Flavobacterium sp. LC2016-13]